MEWPYIVQLILFVIKFCPRRKKEKDNLLTRPSIRRGLVKSTWNHDEKMISGLRVSKPMSSCSVRRVHLYASRQQGTLKLADDPEEMLIQLNYFWGLALIYWLALERFPWRCRLIPQLHERQRCHPLSGFPSSGPKLVAPPYQNSTGEILHPKQQRCRWSAQHGATHHAALSPHDWFPWKPRLLLDLDPALFSSGYLPGDEPITAQMSDRST